jgi:two-component system, sensor histidine kinase and response regulator
MNNHASSKKSILVIDDMKLNFLIIQKTFEKIPNWSVHYVQDPRASIDFLKNQPVDLILLDYEMPHINGPELCEKIKSHSEIASIPILFFTSSSTQNTIERAFQAGADDYINKPICAPELFSRINRIFQTQFLSHELEKKYEEQVALTRLLSHDLNNYMSILGSSAHTLEKNISQLDEFGQRALNRITKTCVRMEELVVNIRSIQAIEDQKIEIKNEKVPIIEILNESVSNFQDKLNAKNIKIEFKKENASSSHFVWTEKTTVLNSVFGNIISNAIKFSHKGDSIDVSTQDVNGCVVISIKDHGIGMDSDLLKKVFNKTEKTSRPGTDNESGTGFGMPLVKSFMEKYGGQIEVESKPQSENNSDHGTTVKLYFKKAA